MNPTTTLCRACRDLTQYRGLKHESTGLPACYVAASSDASCESCGWTYNGPDYAKHHPLWLILRPLPLTGATFSSPAEVVAAAQNAHVQTVTPDGRLLVTEVATRPPESFHAALPRAVKPKFAAGTYVRHVKSGGIYVVLLSPDSVRIEADATPAYVYMPRITGAHLSPKLPGPPVIWVRPQAEMEDGRFVPEP